ncbi:MAG TPA: ATP-binding protein [Vicinamibacterales bacterium]|nr:ATP-binding protein [Vicinamibacterales bacterium]
MITAEEKLTLTELLLSSVDASVCAQKGLEWLGTYVTTRRALLASAAADPGRLWGIAALGISTSRTGEFVLDLDDRRNHLVSAAWATKPTHFRADRRQPETPLENTSFHAVPLRPERQLPPLGLLILEGDEPAVDDDVLWFAEILGEKLQSLRRRNVTADPGVDRERHLLYTIINSVTDPILLTDEAGKLIIGNSRAEQLFAIRAEESEGRRRAVEINNLFFSSALAGRLVEESLPTAREVILVDPEDGSDLLFELLTSHMTLERDRTAIVSVLRNVTDLGRARQELEDNYRRLMEAEVQMRTERNRLDLLVDSVGDPIIVTDPVGDILMTNAPAEKFFTPHTGTSKDAQRRVQANVAQFSSFVSGLMLQVGLMGGQQRWRERLIITEPGTGRAVPMEAFAGSMMAGPSELTGVVTVLHDQTEAMERERLFAELQQASAHLELRVREATAELANQNELLRRQALALEQASAAKSQFLANVSHEFRTPLNAILGYSLMLMGGFYGPLTEEQARTVQRVDANSKHLATLINDVLDIERIEAGRMPLQISQFPLQDVVREVIDELQGVIAQSTAAVNVTLPADLPKLKSDRQKLKQVLVNLVSNALKFTKDGSIEITARHDSAASRVLLSVRDSGVGIAPEDHIRIFEPFQQAKRVNMRPQGGTGLGLAISRRLTRMLGGDISVDSQLGTGATFTVALPLRVRPRATQFRHEPESRRQTA